MAMFPAPSPSSIGVQSSSQCFYPQERHYLSRPNKETTRPIDPGATVPRMTVNIPRQAQHRSDAIPQRNRQSTNHSPASPTSHSLSAHSPVHRQSIPPHAGIPPPGRHHHRSAVGPGPASMFPPMPVAQRSPPHFHPSAPRAGHRSPRDDPSPPQGQKPDQTEELVDDDEAWRTPTPYNERRRAGKHTRRVVIRT